AAPSVRSVRRSGRHRLALACVAVALTAPTVSARSSLMPSHSPYTCCWPWALVWAHRAVFDGSRPAWWIAGVLVGAGILFKYTMVLWLPSLALFLLFSPGHRHLLWSRGWWILTALAALAAAPIIMS